MFSTSPFFRNFIRPFGLVSVLTGLALGAGCADDEAASDEAQDCSGHGWLHDDHCHCEADYVLSEDTLSCVLPTPNNHDGDDTTEPDDHDHDENNHDEDNLDHDTELDFTPTTTHASMGQKDGKQFWFLEAVAEGTILELEIHEEFGGPTSPGVVDITEAATNYATCGTCVVLRTGCEAHEDHFHCAQTFMPRAEGQMHLDAIGVGAGDHLTGELLGLVFQEVVIGEDHQTEPVIDGDVLHLDVWSFDVQPEIIQAAEECGGHGELHGDHCHCDADYVADPEDPTQCIPE